MKLSVLIITYNREKELRACLESLLLQTVAPYEVVVVDNDSSKIIRQLCKQFKKDLNLKYLKEKRLGIPYARNKSILKAGGDIGCFIDDDCVADTNWLKEIHSEFTRHDQTDIALGYARSFYPRVIPMIEQVFYDRWVLNETGNIFRRVELKKFGLVDFKNCAVRMSVLRGMPKLFANDIPFAFGSVAGNEDIEFGSRLFNEARMVVYNPKILVSHKNSLTLYKLLKRNYENGCADQKLLLQKNIETKGNNSRYRSQLNLWKSFYAYYRNMDILNKLKFISTILLAVSSYKFGRYFKVNS